MLYVAHFKCILRPHHVPCPAFSGNTTLKVVFDLATKSFRFLVVEVSVDLNDFNFEDEDLPLYDGAYDSVFYWNFYQLPHQRFALGEANVIAPRSPTPTDRVDRKRWTMTTLCACVF